MFPSLAALGGTLGLLGLREPELVGSASIAELNGGLGSGRVDTVALRLQHCRCVKRGRRTRESRSRTLVGALPVGTTVTLVGGGIANIIAAYELSRIGIWPVVLEATGRLGGRMVSYAREAETATAWSEAGAARFPRGGLVWHYVAQWVRAQGFDPEKDNIQAPAFPSPGTVPTMLSYQGETYEWGPGLDNLPPIVREARARFADYLAGLSTGDPDPGWYFRGHSSGAWVPQPDPSVATGTRGGILDEHAQGVRRALVGQTYCRTTSSSGGSDVHNLMTAFGNRWRRHGWVQPLLRRLVPGGVAGASVGRPPRSSWCRSSTSIPSSTALARAGPGALPWVWRARPCRNSRSSTRR